MDYSYSESIFDEPNISATYGNSGTGLSVSDKDYIDKRLSQLEKKMEDNQMFKRGSTQAFDHTRKSIYGTVGSFGTNVVSPSGYVPLTLTSTPASKRYDNGRYVFTGNIYRSLCISTHLTVTHEFYSRTSEEHSDGNG